MATAESGGGRWNPKVGPPRVHALKKQLRAENAILAKLRSGVADDEKWLANVEKSDPFTGPPPSSINATRQRVALAREAIDRTEREIAKLEKELLEVPW